MTRLFRSAFASCLLVLLVGVLSLHPAHPARAQDRDKPFLRITNIDIANFPTVDVYVYGENLGGELGQVPLTLLEDRAEQTVQNSAVQEVGVQMAFVVDASRNILSPGNTGEPRHTEVASAANNFVQLQLLSAQTDWLAAYTTSPTPGQFEVIADWQQDHQAVANALFQYQPSDALITTELFGLIKFTLDRFEASPAPPTLRRSMTVFSDGTDVVSGVQIDDIIRRSAEMDVRIDTVLLGTGATDARQNLRRLADVTGGSFIELTTVDATDPLWRDIASERTQRVLTYQSDEPQPQELEVRVPLENNSTLEYAREYPIVGAQPPEIAVVQPAGEFLLTRVAETPGMTLTDMSPTVLDVLLVVEWVDGYERTFERIEYSLNDETRLQTEAPFGQFQFPIAEMDEGSYTLRVRAVDSLGLVGEAAPVSFRIEIDRVTVVSEPANTDVRSTVMLPATVPVPSLVTSTVTSSVPLSGTLDSTLTKTGNITAAEASSMAAAPGILRVGRWELPPTATIFNRTVPLNSSTVLFAAFPLLLLIFLLLYWGRRTRSVSPTYAYPNESPYGDVGFDDQSSVTVPAVAAFGVDDDVTEPVRLLQFEVSAHLIYESGGDHLPKEFPLQDGREIRIGRRSNLCDIVMDDRRVSRQHATIEGRADGFYIRDDGSAGGTYVNQRRLGVTDDRKLADGDIINFNEVAYRFTRTSRDDDATVPNTELD